MVAVCVSHSHSRSYTAVVSPLGALAWVGPLLLRWRCATTISSSLSSRTLVGGGRDGTSSFSGGGGGRLLERSLSTVDGGSSVGGDGPPSGTA